MNKVQTEIQPYIASEVIRKNFMNYFRYVKTLNLLKNLYLSEAINRSVYQEESQQVQQKLNVVKKDLKNYDLQRFCQLWGLQAEYQNIGAMEQGSLNENNKEVRIIAKIANLLPQINDIFVPAVTYGQINDAASNFSLQIIKMKQHVKNLAPAIVKVIDEIVKLQNIMRNKYSTKDKLQQSQKDLLIQNLTKFRVEFQRIYHL